MTYRQSIPIRSADQASARVLTIAAGASVIIHAGIAVTVLTAKLTAPPTSDYWTAAPAWTTEIAFNNDPQLKSPQSLFPAPVQKTDAKTPLEAHDESTPNPAELAAKPPEPKELEVRPGIDDSTSDSRDWIGSAIPTPHAAPKSSVNQAGQSMDPGDPGAPGSQKPDQENTPHTAAPSPTQQLASQQAANANKPAASREQSQAQQEEQHKSVQRSESRPQETPPQPKLITPIELDELGLPKQPESKTNTPKEPPKPTEANKKPQEDSRDEQDALPKPSILGALSPANKPIKLEDPADESNESQQEVTQQPTPQSATNNTNNAPATKSATTGDGGNQKLPGEKTDAESAPSSIDNTLEYKPGRPLAGKGIRVRPVAARFSHTTQLTALPKNPRLIIKFNRAGRVVSVEFENKEGTGYPDVDAPLRDSIFRWTASGKALLDLPTHDPQATVTMKIEYILRPE